MFQRPLVTIAICYAAIIIILSPLFPKEKPSFNEKTQIPVVSAVSEKFVSVIKETTPAPYDALLGSVVFGSSVSPLDYDLKENYKKVGLAHLLVASGTQVSILIGVSLAIVRFLKIQSGIGVALVSIINILFALMAGCGASIVRAAIMGEIALAGTLFNRESEIYTSLALSALLLMLFDPLIIFDLGFQLSFAATWALVYFCPILEKKGIPSVISVSLAPILATLPITLYNFNQISLAALPVNIMVVPWVELMTVIGFVSQAAGVVFLPAAQVLNLSLLLMLKLLNGIVYTFAGLPLACIYLKQIWFPFLVVYYAALVIAAENLRGRQMFKFNKENLVLLALLFAALFVWNAALNPEIALAQNELSISVIDVGQGDAIFVKSPVGRTMLIDAGKKTAIKWLRKQGVNKLDVVVLTHPHDDHLCGMPAILKEMPVGIVMDSGQPHTSKAYLEFLNIIAAKNIPYKVTRAGDAIDLGSGVTAEVLHPSEPLIEESALNNNSIVLHLMYGDFAMLLMGDAESEGEAAILEKFGDIRTNYLKVGHHGSRTASSQEFLDAVKPKVAVISVGRKNMFHHPHAATLKRLEENGAKVYRTDESGTITIKTDGEKVIFSPPL